MATKAYEDLVDAAACLLAHGVTQVYKSVSIFPTHGGFVVYKGLRPEPIQEFRSASDAARYLVTQVDL